MRRAGLSASAELLVKMVYISDQFTNKWRESFCPFMSRIQLIVAILICSIRLSVVSIFLMILNCTLLLDVCNW